ncbi:hypothetical protein KP509_21G046100 [Ceratopteris richardii]|nr:hypothetical protein KP509_21G046100 [Ceratopteris richardii]
MDLKLLCMQGRLIEAVEFISNLDVDAPPLHTDTCALLLETCIRSRASDQAHQIYYYMVTKEMKPSLFLNTRLIDMHAKMGNIDKALDVFHRMKTRDVIVWNALIAGCARHEVPLLALELFSRMKKDGILPDESTFVALLIACGRLGNLEEARQMHGYMIMCGVHQDLPINNTLIDIYGKCESIIDAYGVFVHMSSQNVISWTAMIAAYAKHGYGEEAIALFDDMKSSGIHPDEVTFLMIINACATVGDFGQGVKTHLLLIDSGISLNIVLQNALIDMYSKCGSMENAFQVFSSILNKDHISWTTLIAGYAKQGKLEKALTLCDSMCKAGINPNHVTFMSILNACAALRALDEGKEIHSMICKIGISSNIVMECNLIDMYSKCGCIESARCIFDQMDMRDSVAWNALITGYIQHGHLEMALCLFQQMRLEGVNSDEGTFVNVLNICAGLTTLDKGKQLHVSIDRTPCRSALFVSSALVDMYCKCGDILGARELFDHTLPNKCVVIWTAMITGYAQHGLHMEAFQFIKKMLSEGVKLNDLSFQKVLSACSYAGLVEEACFIFMYMSQVYGIKPHIEHYTCLVDLLGRTCRLEEAGYIINEMNCEETPEVWMALLGACRLNGHVELAESAANCILKFMPYNSSAFLLLRDIYATAELLSYQENG